MTAPIQTLVVERAESVALRTVDDHSTHAIVLPDRPADRAMAMINHAIERGLPVETLEKLLAMEERVSARQAAQDFNAALAAFQAECGPIKKSSTAKIATRGGSSYSYTYADLDEIARHIRPLLVKHGLSYSFDSRLDKEYLTCVCTLQHLNGHCVPATFTLPTANESAMSAQQKVGAALTFARRQSLTAALGLTTTDDDVDGAEMGSLDPTPITEDQQTQILDLIDETHSNHARFLSYMGVASVALIRAADFNRAVKALKDRKRGQAK